MSEMIERVAQALEKLQMDAGDYAGIAYVDLARAAIEAMQLPTKEMEEAGFQAGSIGDGGDHWEYADPASTYMAMISEALK